MKCMNCGAELTDSAYCPNCGFDVSVQKQAIVLSGLYYNQGLEKAQVRDLSGAIDQLKRSLKYNKENITARNLLGLVCFETGEVVAALSEWVISKNIQPENNIAADYIENLQRDANRMDLINQTIKKYNIALRNCQDGNEDVAMIQLKKILAQNPKLVKAYHLLALLYIHKEQYEKARRLLRRAIRIDKTNTTTLRFLREVDEQTGTATALESRFSIWNRRTADAPKAYEERPEETQPTSYHAPAAGLPWINILIGILIGAAAIWFLFIPAKTRSINRTANEKVTKYSSDMAVYSAQAQALNKEIETSRETVSSANARINEANAKATANENLLKAVDAFQNKSVDTAATALGSVDPTLLSVEAKEVYKSMTNELQTSLLSIYKKAGLDGFGGADYEAAITNLEKARSIDGTDYDTLNYLAHAYRLKGDAANADKIFQMIIDAYPGTQRAENAQQYLSVNADQLSDASAEETRDQMTAAASKTAQQVGAAASSDSDQGNEADDEAEEGDDSDNYNEEDEDEEDEE